MTLKHLRSSTANKRPLPAAMADGQLAMNTASGSPGLFLKNSNGDLVKIGPVHVGSGAPNATVASGGASGNTIGEQWLDTSGGTYVFKIWDGNGWRSEAGEFINTTGDTMTGSLTMGTSADIIFEGSIDDGFETTLTVANPTADRTITLPDVTGTVITTGDTGSITSTMILNGTILDADVNASAAIAGTKISPDFGSQNTTTTGTSTAASFIPTSSGVPANGLYLPSANNVALATNGTGRLFVDGSGNVAVNTSASTTSRLEVSRLGGSWTGPSVVTGTALTIHPGTGTTTSPAHLAILAGNASNSVIYFGDTDSTSAGAISYIHSSDSLRFDTNGSEKLRITSAGLVGVGTSSPATLMHLSSATGTNPPTPTELRIATTSNGGTWSTTDPWGRISFYSADLSGAGPKIHAAIDAVANSIGGNSNIFFRTSSDSADTLSDRMAITPTGVGIGTASPGDTLELGSGSIVLANTSAYKIKDTGGTARNVININTGNSTLIGTAASSNRFLLEGTGTGEAARIDSSGRLLVGTSSARTFDSQSATLTPLTQIEATDASSALSITRNSANSSAPGLFFGKSRSGTLGGVTAIIADDTLGTVVFEGADGTNLIEAALIRAEVDGTPGTNDMPGRLVFSTTADGASSPTERMRISNAGTTTLTSAASTAPFIANISTTEAARIDSSGRLLMGTTTSTTNTFTTNVRAQIVGATAARDSSLALVSYVSAASSCPHIELSHSKSGAVGTNTVSASGDAMGNIVFSADDGTNFIRGAQISAQVDGTPGLDDMPGRLVFSTTADGSATPTERLRISNAGTTTLTSAASTAPFIANISTSEVARIDSSGRLLVGTSSSRNSVLSGSVYQAQMQLESEVSGGIAVSRFNTGVPGQLITIQKGRGTIASPSVVVDGDVIGTLVYSGYDGTQFVNSAFIRSEIDGTPGANDMPGRLIFSTTADGASSPTEQFRITNDGVRAYNQPAPATVNTSSTLTVANLKTGIIASTPAFGVTLTVPSGGLVEAGFSGIYTNMAFEWSVINLSGANAITVASGVTHTITGSATVAANVSARYATRRTATNTFVSYRLS